MRHVKERHVQVEHWNCVANGCSSKFIRLSYLSRYLVWKHGYGQIDAREAALVALRGDIPKQHGDLEDISEDDSIFYLLAEREEKVKR